MIYPANTNLCRSAFFLIFLFSFLTVNAQIPINDSPCISGSNPPLDLSSGGSHAQTTCGALGPNDPGSLPGNTADWENQSPCNNTTEDASVWYMYTPNIEEDGLDIIVNSVSIANMMTVQFYTATDPSSFCSAAPIDSNVINSSCSDLSAELRVPICDYALTYFIKVTTSNDDCGEFNISINPSNVCQYANTCEEAIDSLLTITQESCADPLQYITVPGCLDMACPSDSSSCAADQGPTVWFKIVIDDPAATALITQVEANGFDAVWSVYQGTSCADMIPVANQEVIDGVTQTFFCSNSDGDPGNLFITLINPNTLVDSILYWVSVTALGNITDPNFDFSYNSAIACSACSGDTPTDCNNGNFTASIMENGEWTEVNDDFQFCQGIDVQVCIDFNYNTTGSGNDWLHGVVPVFGPGWDVDDSYLASIAPINNFEFFSSADSCGAYLNGYDLPNICTYMEDGVLKLCNTSCSSACPCSGGMQDGDPLPSGFWYNSPGGTASCDTLECSPASYFGWPSGTNVEFNMCLELKTKQFDSIWDCADNRSLKIIIQTFSDAITGCWLDANPCVVDPSIQGPQWEIECNSPPIVSGTNVEICHNETLNLLVQTSDGSTTEIQVDVIDNPNITGENSHSFTGGSGFIQDILSNTTDTTHVVSYILSAIDSSLNCEGMKDTLEVTVYSEVSCTNPCIPDTVNVCRLDSGIDSLCINFNALTAGSSGIWNQIDFIPGFNFNDFTLDSVCFEGLPTGCYSFTFTPNMLQIPCVDSIATMIVCVNPCPCPNPATLSIPDLCNIDMFNLEDAQLTLDMGSWSVIDGPVGQDFTDIIIDDIFIAEDILSGEYVVRFTLDNPGGPLCDAFSEQTINVIGLEQINVIGNGQMCNIENQQFSTSLDLYSLISVDANHGGSWTQTGTETILPVTDGSTISSSGVMDYSQTFTFVYTSPGTGGPCPLTQIEVLVNIFDCSCPMLLVSSASLCNEGSLLDLNSLLTNDDNLPGTWSTDGNLVGPNIFDATGLISDVYTITYTLDSSPNPDCPLEYSNTIIVSDQPTAELNQGPQPCSLDTGNGPTAINLYNWLQSDYTLGSWSQTSGNIMVLSDDGINTAIVDFTGQNIGDQFTFLFTTMGAQDPFKRIL